MSTSLSRKRLVCQPPAVLKAESPTATGNQFSPRYNSLGSIKSAPRLRPRQSDFGVKISSILSQADFANHSARKVHCHYQSWPEYDADTQTVEFCPASRAVESSLARSVDTRGWISSDFHSHSEIGRQYVQSTGRVLNLLAEHLEFAPCTEHNRIDYMTMVSLKPLELATCTGIELTGSPFPSIPECIPVASSSTHAGWRRSNHAG
jgi:hypothetical protein